MEINSPRGVCLLCFQSQSLFPVYKLPFEIQTFIMGGDLSGVLRLYSEIRDLFLQQCSGIPLFLTWHIPWWNTAGPNLPPPALFRPHQKLPRPNGFESKAPRSWPDKCLLSQLPQSAVILTHHHISPKASCPCKPHLHLLDWHFLGPPFLWPSGGWQVLINFSFLPASPLTAQSILTLPSLYSFLSSRHPATRPIPLTNCPCPRGPAPGWHN